MAGALRLFPKLILRSNAKSNVLKQNNKFFVYLLDNSSNVKYLAPVILRWCSTDGSTPVSSYEQKESFIPLTRLSLMRKLLQQRDFLTEEEGRRYENFALALDQAIAGKHQEFMHELKMLFDTINPDKDTSESRKFLRKQQLDNEFWLLKKLSTVLEKANFTKLSTSVVDKALSKQTKRGVQVAINTDQYDVLQFWTLGTSELPSFTKRWYQSLVEYVRYGSLNRSTQYYKRVVVAMRLKRHDKLTLKAFKQVPCDDLELLLPAGHMTMTRRTRLGLLSSLGVTGVAVLSELLANFLGVFYTWPFVIAGVTGATSAGLWIAFKGREHEYLLDLSRTLYFKNIANNKGLLSLLVDKAQEETFKEALLAYTFLLAHRPPSARDSATSSDSESVSSTQLQHYVTDWLERITGQSLNVDLTDAINLLQNFNLIKANETGDLQAYPLQLAANNLPYVPHNLTSRIEEYDMVEGFDVERGILDEMDEEYRKDDKLLQRFGWY